MLFPHVKISSFHTKAHLIFHWCLYNKLYLLVITYELHKLRHTSKVKEKTVFFALPNMPCTFDNGYIILDCVSEGLKVTLEAVVYSKKKKIMRRELFLAKLIAASSSTLHFSTVGINTRSNH